MVQSKSPKIQVLIVGAHAETASEIAEFLSETEDIQLIGSEENGANGIQRARETSPNIVLVDSSTPDINSIEVVKAIKSAIPTTKIIMMSVASDPEWMRAALLAGGNTFLIKPIDKDQLFQIIYFVNQA